MITLDGRSLRIPEVAAIARAGEPGALAPEARARVAACTDLLDSMIADGTPIYGITTDFGALDGRKVSRAESDRLQLDPIRSHAAAVGEPMAADEVRRHGGDPRAGAARGRGPRGRRGHRGGRDRARRASRGGRGSSAARISHAADCGTGSSRPLAREERA